MSAARAEETVGAGPLIDIASHVLALAKQHGAKDADVAAARGTEFEVKVADGAINTLTQATSKGLGLRVFVEGRMGFCTTSDFTPASLEHAVARAVAMAKEAAPDPYNGLPELAPGHIEGSSLDVYDPAIEELSAEKKIAWAHELERAARAVDPRVKKFRDSGIASGDSVSVLVTSGGAVRSLRSSGITAWCNPIAESDSGELQTEMWYDSRTHLEDLDAIEAIGRRAGERAVRMLGARPVKTQEVPVIFEAQMAAGLIAGILGAVNGDMVFKKASFLADKLGEVIANPQLTVIDDPLLPRGTASVPFDGEGLATYRKSIIDAGRLTTFLYDSYTARKANAKPTASARRGYSSLPHASAFNFYVEKGTDAAEEILNSAERALLVTRGLGSGVDTVTGEYSRGANGLWLEKGEVIHPVQEVTIAGDFLAMLKNIDRIGDDWQMRGSVGAPTMRVATMMVSGS